MTSKHDARKRLDILLQQMRKRYPDVALSFGYIGNCGAGFDDRSWMFFTKVKPLGHANCLSFGHSDTAGLDAFADRCDGHLERWLENIVQPNVKDVYRNFRIVGPWRINEHVERVIEDQLGLHCGLKGGGRFEFSAQWLTVETLNKALGHLANDCEVEQLAAA
jgi:hypothetical protein